MNLHIKKYKIFTYIALFFSFTSLSLKAETLLDAIASFGYTDELQKKALINLMDLTGCFKNPENINGNIKKEDWAQLYSGATQEGDYALMQFKSLPQAQAYIVASTQSLWFKSTWAQEKAEDVNATSRWTNPQDVIEEFADKLIENFETLRLVSEIKRPEGFMPNRIIWLGSVEHLSFQGILADIPEGYNGEIVVHSNRRGLFLCGPLFEPTGLEDISEKLGIAHNDEAVSTIESILHNIPNFYNPNPASLDATTKPFRDAILDSLRDKGLIDNSISDFSWPTEKELYSRLFKKAQSSNPSKLGNATLIFDDPEPLENGSFYDTETEAKVWLEKVIGTLQGKENLLALSTQPFVEYQNHSLQRVLGDYFNVVTVGLPSQYLSIPDCLETVAKIIYGKATQDEAIKTILPWVK